jgi:hypothetical protein
MATYSSKKYPAGSVTSAQLADGTVVAVDLADGAVTSAKLNSTVDLSGKTVTYRSIVAGDIASNAITTAKISDANITPAKMANSGAEFGMRNRVINGAMTIAQRTTSAVVSNESGQYPVDRFYVESYGGGVLTSQQSSTAPAGFNNSTIITVTTTDTSLASTDDYEINHKIEGFNVADLGWGTASAKTITLSFWVRSSVIGSYSVGFQNSAASRSYVGTYTINSANTWEQKSITVVGDTSGTWGTGNGTGFFLRWCLATGSNRVASSANTWESANRIAISATANPIMGTSGATFYITGVQLEVGSTATPFENRSYGTELALCQRYYQQRGGNSNDERIAVGFAYLTTQGRFIYPTRVVMRTSPTLTVSSGTDFNIEIAGAAITSTSLSLDQPSPEIIAINCNVASGLTGGAGCQLQARNGNARIMFSAEL